MKFRTWLLLCQFIIFLNQRGFVTAKAMIGQNIRQARSREYSFVVSIMRVQPGNPHNNGDHFCTGVIITKQDVLTADHCLEGEILNTVQIVIGTIDLRNGTVYYPFWWETYNQWADMTNLNITYNWNDMANIRILFKVPDHIIPARLSRLSNTELTGADVTMAGWGLNEQRITPDIMNIGSVKVEPNNVCEAKIERVLRMRISLNIRILCSFVTPYILVDEGDSGGPLLFRNRLVALNIGLCPILELPIQASQVNLHIGIHYYREFVNYMKRE